MKKFIKNILCFTTLIVLLAGVIEILLLSRPNEYSYKRAYLERHLDDIQVLLLGNSHIEEGICPDVIGHNCYNFAIAGRDLVYEIELAKRYIPQMSNLEVVVMPLDYSWFSLGRYVENPNEEKHEDLEKAFNRTKKCMYYKYMGLRIDPFWYWSEFLNSNDKFLNRFWDSEKDIIECDSLGYVKVKLENRRDDWATHALPSYIDLSKPRNEADYKWMKEQYSILADLVKKQNAKLILVDVPMYETFRTYVVKSLLEERLQFVEELKRVYENIYFFEYMNLTGFTSDDFQDASHLSEYGAPKFSKILKTDIESLMAKSR